MVIVHNTVAILAQFDRPLQYTFVVAMQAMKPRSSKGATRGLVVLSVVHSWMKAAVEEGEKRNLLQEKMIYKERKKQRLSKH